MPRKRTTADNNDSVNFLIDLLSITGAYTANVGDENVVVIPFSTAEVTYFPASGNSPERATIRTQACAYGEAYRQKVIVGQMTRNGRCNDSAIPTHRLSLAHSRKFIRQCIKQNDIVDEVISQNIASHPEIAGQDPLDSRSLLYMLIVRYINVRIAQGYSGRYRPDRLSAESITKFRKSRADPFVFIDNDTDDLPY